MLLGGNTPFANLNNVILRENNTTGKEALFKKTEWGKFTTKGQTKQPLHTSRGQIRGRRMNQALANTISNRPPETKTVAPIPKPQPLMDKWNSSAAAGVGSGSGTPTVMTPQTSPAMPNSNPTAINPIAKLHRNTKSH